MLRFIFFPGFFPPLFKDAGGRWGSAAVAGRRRGERARPAPSEMTGSAPGAAAGHSAPLHIYRSGCRGAN